MTPKRQAEEEQAAKEYAEYILNLSPPEGWSVYNRAIIDRWSFTALQRIKRRAWQIVDNPR